MALATPRIMIGGKMIVRFEADPWTDGLKVYIAHRHGDRVSVAKPVDLQFEPLDLDAGIAQTVEPTLTLGGPFAHAFKQAFAEALSEDGVKTESDHRIAGTLDAVREHLADMRTLALGAR